MPCTPEKSDKYFEHTILTIFLWIGIWGTISLFLDHYVQAFGAKLLTYILFTISSFSLLHVRDHI